MYTLCDDSVAHIFSVSVGATNFPSDERKVAFSIDKQDNDIFMVKWKILLSYICSLHLRD